MDPSYTNGVGTPVPPNNSPGVPPQPTPQSFSSSQPGPQPSASVRQIPVQQVPSSVSPQQPVIPSGTDDIILSGSSEKKHRKGLIAIIIAVVVLILAGTGFLLWQNGVFGNSPRQIQTATLQEKYNSYVNYVLWGTESTDQPNLNEIYEASSPYFQSLLEGDSDNASSSINEYINKADSMFSELNTKYIEQQNETQINLIPLKTYYEDYAKIQSVSDVSIINAYISGGQTAAESLMDEKYSTTSEDQNLAEYIEASKNYININLEMLAEMAASGCIQDGNASLNCYKITDEEKTRISDSYFIASEKAFSLSVSALETLSNLYIELYGEPESEPEDDAEYEETEEVIETTEAGETGESQ